MEFIGDSTERINRQHHYPQVIEGFIGAYFPTVSYLKYELNRRRNENTHVYPPLPVADSTLGVILVHVEQDSECVPAGKLPVVFGHKTTGMMGMFGLQADRDAICVLKSAVVRNGIVASEDCPSND